MSNYLHMTMHYFFFKKVLTFPYKLKKTLMQLLPLILDPDITYKKERPK